MKPLFVTGSPRSGTTALTDYLNQHPEILICRERYKFAPLKVNPSFFTFERILNYDEKETNIPREHHAELLTRKDPERLKWIGDKYPHYVKHFKELARNNPGAHFLVLYRPLEEVAESFEARAKDPQDRWPEKNGFERGVQVWNSTLRSTREFIEGSPNHNALFVSYHDFFYRNEACISLISRFLGVEFDESVRETCKKMSFRFEILRRSKDPLTEEQASFVRDNKDRAAEEWILDRMDKQWREFGRIPVIEPTDRREVERQIEELERQLAEVRWENQQLRQSNQRVTTGTQALMNQMQAVEAATEQPRRHPSRHEPDPDRTIKPENIVWILGFPRTGSTWLSRILGEPKDHVVWREPFFGVVLGFRNNIANRGYVDNERFLLGEPHKDVWLKSMRRLFLDVCRAKLSKLSSEHHLIVKEPNGSMSAPLILEAFPESKLVFLVRDSRDVVSSLLDAARKGSWCGYDSYEASAVEAVLQGGGFVPLEHEANEDIVEQLARNYLTSINAVKEAYAKHPENQKVLVRYEDLRVDTFKSVKRIYSAVGIDVEDETLAQVVEKHSWENIPQEQKGLGKFHRKGAPGGWREDLTTKQVQIIEEITLPLLEEFYPEGSILGELDAHVESQGTSPSQRTSSAPERSPAESMQAKVLAGASGSVEETLSLVKSVPQLTHGFRLAGGMAQGKALNLDDYDFLDFGASKGGSIEFARRRLRGVRGIGIDIDPRKVELMLEAGYDCMQGDITKLDFPSDSVRFVVMSHLLEHLPDLQAIEDTLRSAARVASDFLFIQGPSFDADEFLRSQRLKFYWSDWHGHKCHLTTSQLRKILLDLGLKDFVIMGCGTVTDSFDSAVHPLDSPRDQHAYDPEIHPGKPFVNFRQPLYKEMVCYVRLRPFNDWKKVLQARKGCKQIDTNIEQRDPERFSTATQRSRTHYSGRHDTVPDRISPAPERLLAKKVRVETRGGTAGYVDEIEKRLMLVRRWSYLRYLHMREGLLRAEGIESVLAVGCGRGYAEVALALEFPEIRFHLTDVQGARTPHYHTAQRLVQRWTLDNVTFGIRDILVPEQRDRYDLVASVEVLEHIENDTLAAEEMRAAANKYVFALVPFADKAANGNEELRARVYKSHEHHRVGYDDEDLRRLFPDVVAMRGCYWKERGGELRKRLHSMSDEEIQNSMSELRVEAQRDVVEAVPKIYPEAQGIWLLAEV